MKRDPYLYEDVDVLINRGNIKDADVLKKAEADVTKFSMAFVLTHNFTEFNTETVQEIHKIIFGDLYPWAGEFRTIQIIKREQVLGGDTVRYTEPAFIKSELDKLSKEIAVLRKAVIPQKEQALRLIRITSKLWQIHPFREGNTRTVVAFSILLAQHLGISIDYSLIERHAAYVRNSLVWTCQGIYSKFEYLEKIYFDAAGISENDTLSDSDDNDYTMVGEYNIVDYKEQPHEYVDNDK